MEIAQRIRTVEEKLQSIGMSVNTWSKSNELDHRIVEDLLNGKLQGTRGVAMMARRKIEEFFGNIFEDK